MVIGKLGRNNDAKDIIQPVTQDTRKKEPELPIKLPIIVHSIG